MDFYNYFRFIILQHCCYHFYFVKYWNQNYLLLLYTLLIFNPDLTFHYLKEYVNLATLVI